MKIIKINESQYKRLFEADSVPGFNGTTPNISGKEEMNTTTSISTPDGDNDKKLGNPAKGDDIAKKIGPSDFWNNIGGPFSRGVR
jgi:hypothetical protein